jgi:hypothetical protein
MTSFTDAARSHLEDYLQKVRLSLAGYRSVDAEDVVRDIRGHIAGELAGASEPVALPDLDAVLARLGPEDWRLAYLAFGLLFLVPFFPPAIFFSFLLARATLALAGESEVDLGARRWLLYPSLLAVYVSLGIGALAWPPFVMYAGLVEWHTIASPPLVPAGENVWLAAAPWVTAGLGLWWILVGALAARFPAALRSLFYPFLGNVERKAGGRLVLLGLFLTLTGVALGLAWSPLTIP